MWEATHLDLCVQLEPTISSHILPLDPGVGDSFPWAVNAAVAAPGPYIPMSLTMSPPQSNFNAKT